MITTIYLIRHSMTLKDYKKIEVQEDLLTENKKIPLSIEGEDLAKEYFSKEEFKNIDVVYSSNYVRAISTAKYLANYNNVTINISDKFNERVHGINDWSELPSNFELNQFNDELYKIGTGESKKEVRERMQNGINELLSKYKGKRIAIIGHATSISYLLDNWCITNYLENYSFNGNVFFDGNFNYLETFKLEFDKDNNLVNISNFKA